MQGFKQNVTKIKGLSDRRRMPLLNKVRLGIKKENAAGVSFPSEVDFFVVPDEVKEIYGDKPKKLEIMFPINDIEAVFPTAYIFYGKSVGVKCKGDGEKAWHVNPETKEMVERSCPCEMLEARKCKQVGRLLFMIPAVSVAGVYQMSTSSYNSIIDIGSGLDFVQAMVGRFAFITLEMKRIPTDTHHEGKRQVHHTIQITLPDGFNIQALADMRADNERIFTQAQYQLPAPVEENPEFDPVDVVEGIKDEENNGKEPVNVTPETKKPGPKPDPAKPVESKEEKPVKESRATDESLWNKILSLKKGNFQGLVEANVKRILSFPQPIQDKIKDRWGSEIKNDAGQAIPYPFSGGSAHQDSSGEQNSAEDIPEQGETPNFAEMTAIQWKNWCRPYAQELPGDIYLFALEPYSDSSEVPKDKREKIAANLKEAMDLATEDKGVLE